MNEQIWDDVWSSKRELTEFEKKLYHILYLKSLKFKGGRILEAGCGTGRGIIPFSDKCECYGMDTSKEALKLTKKNFGRKVSVIRADIRNMPFKDNFFRFVFNSGVIEHLDYPDDLRAINEMARVSSGEILFVVPNKLCLWYVFGKGMMKLLGKWPYGFEKSYSPCEIMDLAKKAGLKKIKIHTMLHFIPPSIGFMKCYPKFLLPLSLLFEKMIIKAKLKTLFAYALAVEGEKA